MTETGESAVTPRLAMFKATIAHTAEVIAEELEHEPPRRRSRRSRRSETSVEDLDFARTWPMSTDTAKTRPGHHEKKAIAEYDTKKLSTQRQFAADASTTRPGTLVLREFYDRAWAFTDPNATLIATMLAARAEANGRVWLNDIEGGMIADALEQTGRDLLTAGLPRFAEKAFDEAAAIHSKFKDLPAEDRCEYLKSNAHRRTYPWWSPKRAVWTLSWSWFGYGYKPMRLLGWIALVITGFTVWMLLLPRAGDTTWADALFMAFQNFVNPMGLGDATTISKSWEPVLELETYTGEILRNIFFVLLIRRWFRL